MALEPLVNGTLGDATTVNNNFNYLDGRITTTASSISSLSTQISTVNTNLSNNKANKDLSNVTDATLSSKMSSSVLTPTVLTNAGCLTSSNISSASSTVKNSIISWMMPNWNNMVYRGTDYTLTEDCWVYMQGVVGWANTSNSSKANGVCMSGGLGRGDSTMTCGGIWIGKSGDHISGSFGIYTVPFVGRS